MIIWIIRILVVMAGPLIGWWKLSPNFSGILIGTGIALGVLLVEILIERIPLDDIIFGIIGVVLGIITVRVLNYGVGLAENAALEKFTDKYNLLLQIIFGYLGMIFFLKKKEELNLLDKDILKGRGAGAVSLKILDTSAIIDGRIAELGKTKFLEGELIVPRFVLQELQKVADSTDPFKRTKGRRGLDILTKLQENKLLQVKIYEKDYPDLQEVDIKIVKLADEMKARVITTDFNLNKIASLQGIMVLNVNELSDALKPVVLPGDTLVINIIREGKEHPQGVGYLEDGTMVVVEDGRHYIGQKVETTVTSVLQSTAGRIIFCRISKPR